MKNLRLCVDKTFENEKMYFQRSNYLVNDTQYYIKMKAAFLKTKLWKRGATITICFIGVPSSNFDISYCTNYDVDDDNGNLVIYDPLQPLNGQFMKNGQLTNFTYQDIIPMIKEIVQSRVEPIVNLKFVFTDDPSNANIRIGFLKNEGSWSYLGTDALRIRTPSEATMNFGWFDVATVIHEFGHLLGMVHEHQTTYGNNIEWNLPKLYEWGFDTQGWDKAQVNTQIVDKYSQNVLNGSTFDRSSIMIYFFPNELTINNSGTKINSKLSANDVIYINNNYQGSPETPSEFYKNVYGIDILSMPTPSISRTTLPPETAKKINWKFWIFVGLLSALIIRLFII